MDSTSSKNIIVVYQDRDDPELFTVRVYSPKKYYAKHQTTIVVRFHMILGGKNLQFSSVEEAAMKMRMTFPDYDVFYHVGDYLNYYLTFPEEILDDETVFRKVS